MAYDTLERSAHSGRPVDLYTFTRGSAFTWRFTSADREIALVSQTYAPQRIDRDPVEQGPEPKRSNMTLRVPHDFPIAELYKIAPPSDPVFLVLSQLHYGDSEVKQIWEGEVLSVSFIGNEAKIILEPGNLSSTGLRRNYQRSCPFVLYGPSCRVDQAVFRLTATVATLAGAQLTVLAAGGEADGYFDGGFLEWQLGPGTYERRFIHSHVGTAIVLDLLPLGLEVGQEVRLYPGCDHSLSTCNAKFSNAANYGGMPFIPLKNPFGADPIF